MSILSIGCPLRSCAYAGARCRPMAIRMNGCQHVMRIPKGFSSNGEKCRRYALSLRPKALARDTTHPLGRTGRPLGRTRPLRSHALDRSCASLRLPMVLPLTPDYPAMEAKLVSSLPEGPQWQYEPKWDGFRCLAFKDRALVELRSKAGQPLDRYFPEIVEALQVLDAPRCVLDG